MAVAMRKSSWRSVVITAVLWVRIAVVQAAAIRIHMVTTVGAAMMAFQVVAAAVLRKATGVLTAHLVPLIGGTRTNQDIYIRATAATVQALSRVRVPTNMEVAGMAVTAAVAAAVLAGTS